MPAPAPQANPKVVVGVLAVLSFAALVLGFFSILNSIRVPFKPAAETNTQSDAGALALAADDKLKRQDTDSDGLSDYDELYLYSTSPFLKDSDSDGIDDRTEVLHGTDPNCPEGRQCGFALPGTNGNVNGGIPNLNSSTTNTNGSLSGLLGTNVTADTLRQTLKDAGAPAYIVDNTSDQALLDLAQSVLGEQGTDVNTVANTNTATSDQALLGSMRNLTPSEIRDLLKQGGADANLLNQIDDASLQSIFQSAIDEQTNTSTP